MSRNKIKAKCTYFLLIQYIYFMRRKVLKMAPDVTCSPLSRPPDRTVALCWFCKHLPGIQLSQQLGNAGGEIMTSTGATAFCAQIRRWSWRLNLLVDTKWKCRHITCKRLRKNLRLAQNFKIQAAIWGPLKAGSKRKGKGWKTLRQTLRLKIKTQAKYVTSEVKKKHRSQWPLRSLFLWFSTEI